MLHMTVLPAFSALFNVFKNHLFPQNLPKCLQQFIIFLRTHDTETDIGGIQEGEGGAVPDHQAFRIQWSKTISEVTSSRRILTRRKLVQEG